jgi:hypothetical protein
VRLALVFVAACSDVDRTAPEIDPDRITIYFPIEGHVYGRGYPGSTTSPWVVINAHPSDTRTITEVQSDGTFSFDIVLFEERNNVLEITGATDDTGRVRGAPVFVPVPEPKEKSRPRFHCCPETMTCRSSFDADTGVACRPAEPGVERCSGDSDCFHLANEVLPIDPALMRVSPPDANGLIEIGGSVLPRSLVTVENRGLTGIGEGRRGSRATTIADEGGAFSIPLQPGRGDDEVVFQIRDLENKRSPPASVLTPDAELAGVDVISVEGFEPPGPDGTGIVAIDLAPYGADDRGMCPSSASSPSVCFSGGLFHADVTSLSAAVGAEDLAIRPAPVTAERPYVVGARGDVRAEARDFAIVLDVGADSLAADPARRRFGDMRAFVDRLRARDRVGLAAVGGGDRTVEVGDAGTVLAALDEIEALTPSGPRALFEGVARADALLDSATNRRAAELIVVTTGDVPLSVDQALAQVAALRDTVTARVHVIAVGIPPSGNGEALRQLAQFNDGGTYASIATIEDLGRAASDVTHAVLGSFVLLYEADLSGVGKQDCITLDLALAIGGVTIEHRFEGLITLDGAERPVDCR